MNIRPEREPLKKGKSTIKKELGDKGRLEYQILMAGSQAATEAPKRQAATAGTMIIAMVAFIFIAIRVAMTTAMVITDMAVFTS